VDKILIFAVLERWLLQLRETDSSFVFIIDFMYNVLMVVQWDRRGNEILITIPTRRR